MTETFALLAGSYRIHGEVAFGVCGSSLFLRPVDHDEEIMFGPDPSHPNPMHRDLVILAGGTYRWHIDSCEGWTATVSVP